MAKQKGPGRPKLPATEKRTGRFLVKLTDAEYDLIKRAADPRVGTWAREVLLRAAKRRVQ